MSNLEPTIKIEEVLLQKRKFAAMFPEKNYDLGGTVVDSLKVERQMDELMYDVMVRVRGYVLSQKIADDHYVAKAPYKVHSSWWQHFKQERMPAWFNNRWPVQYDERFATVDVKFTRWATYPMANIAIHESNKYLFLKQLGGLEVIQDNVEQLR